MSSAVDHEAVTTSIALARETRQRRFRLAVILASVVAAIVGSVALVMHRSGERVTTRGVTATLRVPAHPGSLAAGRDVLWVALNGDPHRRAGDRPLLRLDLATGSVGQSVRVGGEVSYLARDGGRLIASVTPVGGRRLGPRRLVALDWRSGAVLPLGQSHRNDADAREIDGPVDQVVRAGNFLWALEARPGRLLWLDSATLAPLSAPIRLSSGRTLGLAAGGGYLWATAADAGEVLRIDPATGSILRVHVGGFPVGIALAGRKVWFADRSNGEVVRLDPRTLRPIGDPIRVGTKPSSLAVAGNFVFVTNEDAGTIESIDVHSGREAGAPIRFAPPTTGSVAPALSSSGESVWVSSFPSNTVTRITSPTPLAARSNELTLKGTGDGPVNPGPNGMGVTNGGVAGTGHFTLSGAIKDKGTYIVYRSVTGQVAKLRSVFKGRKGTITIVGTIHLSAGGDSPPPWTIASGTKSYVGLHGRGRLVVDNYESDPYTFVMRGAVSR